jgi:hypothetical protein
MAVAPLPPPLCSIQSILLCCSVVDPPPPCCSQSSAIVLSRQLPPSSAIDRCCFSAAPLLFICCLLPAVVVLSLCCHTFVDFLSLLSVPLLLLHHQPQLLVRCYAFLALPSTVSLQTPENLILTSLLIRCCKLLDCCLPLVAVASLCCPPF